MLWLVITAQTTMTKCDYLSYYLTDGVTLKMSSKKDQLIFGKPKWAKVGWNVDSELRVWCQTFFYYLKQYIKTYLVLFLNGVCVLFCYAANLMATIYSLALSVFFLEIFTFPSQEVILSMGNFAVPKNTPNNMRLEVNFGCHCR